MDAILGAASSSEPVKTEREVVLRLNGITKRFGPLVANDAISFTLRKGEIVGLLGENGAGKTTLMNILFGHYVADEGSIEAFGGALAPGSPAAALRAGIGMVHQHFTLAENLSVLDNIILGTERLFRVSSARRSAQRKLEGIGRDFGLEIDHAAQVSRLSVGERQRVEILKALYRDAKILILDEPTAVLTPQESIRFFDTLKRFAAKGLSIILISHKLGEVLAACSRVAVLRGGKLVAEREVHDVSREELGALMVGHDVPAVKREAAMMGGEVLSISSVTAAHGASRIENLSLTVRKGEVVGIAGVAGNGQGALAALVSGLVAPHSGVFKIGDRVVVDCTPGSIISQGVGRIPEDRHAEGMIGDLSVTENVISENYRGSDMQRWGFLNWTKALAQAQDIIDKFDVKCPSPATKARLLSGGNMQKIILGRALAHAPALVLANQPTRGLDVGAVAYVHQQLLEARRKRAGILLISEDLDELLALSDRIHVIYRGALSEALARADVTVVDLGLRMAGQGFQNAH